MNRDRVSMGWLFCHLALHCVVCHTVFCQSPPPDRIFPPINHVLFQTSPTTRRADPYADQRRQLVETRIKTAGVRDSRVLASINSTPRHEFVPPAYRSQAYLDMALPIGASQTISSPFIVASMTETLDPQPTDRVLEIGTGSGYQAAVLSPLVADVYSIEIVEELGKTAAQVLKKLDYNNVHTRIGDGFLGWPEAAPFDKIIVTCSPESVPQPLIDQLREGGSMIIPVGERYQQTLFRMKKTDGDLVREPLQPTLFVPMTGAAENNRVEQPDPAHPKIVNGNFEEVLEGETAEHYIAGWYYGRQVKRHVEDRKAMARFENQTPGLGSHLLQGIAIDAVKVPTIRLSARIRLADVVKGPAADELPMLAISFYDDQRRDLGVVSIGPYRGSHDWRSINRLIRVPPKTKEAIIRIGLFGATGRIDFDDVTLEKL